MTEKLVGINDKYKEDEFNDNKTQKTKNYFFEHPHCMVLRYFD